MIAVTLAALTAAWRAAYWYLGSEVALAAPQMSEDALSSAETAVRLSPSDPLAHWGLGTLEQRDVSSDALPKAIAEFQKAVSLSPRDFRLWVDLGRALEYAGDMDGSEKALRRATELAPFYSWPRWHMGNFLVRRGRYDEGFKELRLAAEADTSKRGPIFDLAWMIYGGDVKAIKGALGDTPTMQGEFVSYLLGRGRLDEALQLWAGLNSEGKKENGDVGKVLASSLVTAKRFRDALALSRDLNGGATPAEIGRISNGSFEMPVSQNAGGYFDWRVVSNQQAQAVLDSNNPHDGQLSLRINFNAQSTLDLNITQLVAVKPGSSYRLLFYVRANNLKSASMPLVQVLNADGKEIAESAPVSPGKSDWQQFVIDFKTPPNMDGVTVRITRTPCTAEGGVCPIYGTVWYDDFNLQDAGR